MAEINISITGPVKTPKEREAISTVLYELSLGLKAPKKEEEVQTAPTPTVKAEVSIQEDKEEQPKKEGVRREPHAMTKARDQATAAGIDWTTLYPGSGKEGKVTQADVQKAIKAKEKAAADRKRAKENGAGEKGLTDEEWLPKLRDLLEKVKQTEGVEVAKGFVVEHGGTTKLSTVPQANYKAMEDALNERIESYA